MTATSAIHTEMHYVISLQGQMVTLKGGYQCSVCCKYIGPHYHKTGTTKKRIRIAVK